MGISKLDCLYIESMDLLLTCTCSYSVLTWFVVFFFSWASIPLMYSSLKLFRDTSTAYMVLFCGSVFIGITTASCIFLLEYFSDSQVHHSQQRLLCYHS